jgi:hypothetical protein
MSSHLQPGIPRTSYSPDLRSKLLPIW